MRWRAYGWKRSFLLFYTRMVGSFIFRALSLFSAKVAMSVYCHLLLPFPHEARCSSLCLLAREKELSPDFRSHLLSTIRGDVPRAFSWTNHASTTYIPASTSYAILGDRIILSAIKLDPSTLPTATLPHDLAWETRLVARLSGADASLGVTDRLQTFVKRMTDPPVTARKQGKQLYHHWLYVDTPSETVQSMNS